MLSSVGCVSLISADLFHPAKHNVLPECGCQFFLWRPVCDLAARRQVICDLVESWPQLKPIHITSCRYLRDYPSSLLFVDEMTIILSLRFAFCVLLNKSCARVFVWLGGLWVALCKMYEAAMFSMFVACSWAIFCKVGKYVADGSVFCLSMDFRCTMCSKQTFHTHTYTFFVPRACDRNLKRVEGGLFSITSFWLLLSLSARGLLE